MKKSLPIEIEGELYSQTQVENFTFKEFHQFVGFIEKESILYKLRNWREHCPQSLVYLDNLLVKL